MKNILIAIGLAGLAACSLPARETVTLKLDSDRPKVWSGGNGEVVVRIDVVAAPGKPSRRLPLNLAVVLDRSGSMAGAKIEKAKQAAAGLVDQLRAGDTFSLVAYDNTVQVLVEAQPVEDRDSLRSRIMAIRPGGGTALYGGVEKGAAQLRRYLKSDRINRVILLSDGLANVGPSSTEELQRLGRQLSREGLAVTTIGVGDDYNEDLMAGLAEASDANYYYVKDTEKLPEIFAKELGRLLGTAARQVRINVICPEGVEPIRFIGRPERFNGQRASVTLDSLAGDQSRALYLQCRIRETGKLRSQEVAAVEVNYRDELKGVESQNVNARLSVDVIADQAPAERAENKVVVAQRELMWNAVAKDSAIADLDAGNYRDAAKKMESQAVKMDSLAAAAPAAQRIELENEAAGLRSKASQYNQGNVDSRARKEIQQESYKTRNAK